MGINYKGLIKYTQVSLEEKSGEEGMETVRKEGTYVGIRKLCVCVCVCVYVGGGGRKGAMNMMNGSCYRVVFAMQCAI